MPRLQPDPHPATRSPSPRGQEPLLTAAERTLGPAPGSLGVEWPGLPQSSRAGKAEKVTQGGRDPRTAPPLPPLGHGPASPPALAGWTHPRLSRSVGEQGRVLIRFYPRGLRKSAVLQAWRWGRPRSWRSWAPKLPRAVFLSRCPEWWKGFLPCPRHGHRVSTPRCSGLQVGRAAASPSHAGLSVRTRACCLAWGRQGPAAPTSWWLRMDFRSGDLISEQSRLFLPCIILAWP